MRRAALLLELLISLVILVGAGLAVMGMLSQGVRAAKEATNHLKAMDLAMSALAKIEAGIETPERLDGPVSVWVDEQAGSGAAFADSAPPPTDWRLEIETNRAGHADLTIVSVRAIHDRPGGVRFTAAQLLRLTSADPEDENPENSLLRELAGGDR